MFKAFFGNCKLCPPNETKLIVSKKGYCKYHNEQSKNKKPKEVKSNYGNCKCCGRSALIVVKAGWCKKCNEQKKKDEKSKRVVKLVNKSENKKSHPKLKKILWEIFSEYIRIRDSKDGMFVCISCGKYQSAEGGNLQAGHYYKSETYPSLRYEDRNVNSQCKSCNIFKEGNRQGYEIGMLKKYGQETIDILKISCHNKAKLGRFELEVLIKIYTEKLNKLKQEKT